MQQIKIAFANKPYRYVIALYLFSWLALQLISTVLIYYLTYYIGAPDQLPLVLLAIQGTAFVFLFIWTAVSRRLDKRYVYMIGATIWLAASDCALLHHAGDEATDPAAVVLWLGPALLWPI